MESLLIANRGEIARRIIRTARRLGIRTIAVHSVADAAAPFVREADTAVAIGAAPARESYLSVETLLAAAQATRAEAIHPGYGFLSENAAFAEAVQGAGLIWVGAPPAAIRAMGMKDAAKALMSRAGVPVTPGYLGASQAPADLAQAARDIGYPVLIKAVAGGGGKGMRRVALPDEFDAALASCRREAAAAFGDDRVLIEKWITAPRHIEVQVFGDTHGNVVHLFERDCSLQRRHQKVIEEAPAPGMDPDTRRALCEVAVKAARAVDYVGAGTIEFIADASAGLAADRIWFMEMNTRLQVEHPVTEAITGEDLVEWQLRVAAGESLPRRQDELRIHGCAVEARLYAENPSTRFLPSIGPLRHWRMPTGLRIDSGVEEGGEVTAFYDPLLAKLVSHAPGRPAALRALAAACGAVEVWPVRTNAGFLARVAAGAEFLAGAIDTGFIERHADRLIPGDEPGEAVIEAAALALLPAQRADPWSALTGFRSAAAPYLDVAVAIAVPTGERTYVARLKVEPTRGGEAASAPAAARPPSVVRCGGDRVVFWRGEAWRFGEPTAQRVGPRAAQSDGVLRAPMPGRVVAVAVREGDPVSPGQTLVTLEAMKMEQALVAPFAGRVAELRATVGDQVAEETVLVRIEQEGVAPAE
jgi:3-methylcrotonyl-CoA carboxylase alpha subunit